MRKLLQSTGAVFIVPIVVVILATAPLAAQTALGIRAGLGRGTVSIDEDLARTARSGVTIGMDLGLPVSDAVDLRIGGSYAQKGGGAALLGAEADLSMDYVQFSALGRLGTPGPVSAGVLADRALGGLSAVVRLRRSH